MRGKRIFCSILMGAVLLCGCGAENAEDSQAESFSRVQEVEAYASLYEDEALGIEITYPVVFSGGYRVICGEQSGEFEAEFAPEDIQEVTVTPWKESSPFLVLKALLKDGSEQSFVLNSEMMDEVMLLDPVETAGDKIEWTIEKKDETLWLYLNQEPLWISAEDSEALEVLANTIKPTGEVIFGSDGDVFVCDVLIDIYEDDEIGTMRLYYEYDGVGMNCTNAEFIPLT